MNPSKRAILLVSAGLLLAGPAGRAAAATGVVSVDAGEPRAQEAAPRKKKKKRRWWRRGKEKEEEKGDIQVGPAVNAEPAPAVKKKKFAAKQTPGIFPVYEASGRWMLIEKPPAGRPAQVKKGSRLVVIGSKGIDLFYASRSTRTLMAACDGFKPRPFTGYFLSAHSAKPFKRVGKPVIGILLKPGVKFDKKKPVFYPLRNEIREEVYQRLGDTLKRSIAADLESGAFLIKADDDKGHEFAKSPKPEGIQMKIDFGSKIRYSGLDEAFLLVEGAQVSRSYRRCMRLFTGDNPLGECAEMPHELLAETRSLDFVAYDPNARGRPFVLAYTKGDPLWGHERWGFQLSNSGPKMFMRDALDPRCRESF